VTTSLTYNRIKAIRAYLRLEFHRWRYDLPFLEAKLNIIRHSLRTYLANLLSFFLQLRNA